MPVTATQKKKKSLFQITKNQQEEQPVYEQETVDKMKQVLSGDITGDRAVQIRQMFMEEFGEEALNILKKEMKIK